MHKLVPSEIESQMNIIFEIKQKKITFLIKIWKYWRKAADPPTNVSIKLYLALTISNSDTKYYFLLISCKMSVYYTYSSY